MRSFWARSHDRLTLKRLLQTRLCFSLVEKKGTREVHPIQRKKETMEWVMGSIHNPPETHQSMMDRALDLETPETKEVQKK